MSIFKFLKSKLLLQTFIIILIIILSLGLLGMFIKGDKGNPIYFQKEYNTRVGGPYEGSNSTSRYALTISIVKNHSLLLTKDLALFASPDVSYYKGKFFTLFTPGVSFVGVPFYIVGEHFGMPQLFAYLSVFLISLINMLLVARLANKLGASLLSSLLSGFIYLFATNALSYSLLFTQHQPTVLLILLAMLNMIEERTFLNNITFGALYGFGLLFDIPNAFLMLPIGLYILYKSVKKEVDKNQVKIKINLRAIGLLFGIIPFLLIFVWYNFVTTGSYTKFAQTIGRTNYFKEQIQKSPQKSATIPDVTGKAAKLGLNLPFETRSELNGLYILILSNERAWIFYSPIVLLGSIGWFFAFKKEYAKPIVHVSISIVLLDIILYSMFGDPWGGWAFGPRYLIPAAAVLTAGVGTAISHLKKNIFFFIIFIVLTFYSLWVNNIGAITTSEIPPKVEAVNLSNPIPYTYIYNLDLIRENFSSSLIYNLLLTKNISVYLYSLSLFASSCFIVIFLYFGILLEKQKEED